MNRIVTGAALALLAEGMGGCAHTPSPEPVIKTVEVKVPVAVPCKAEVEVRKTYSDAAAEFVSDIYEQAKMLMQGRKERIADQQRVVGAVVGCGGTVTAK